MEMNIKRSLNRTDLMISGLDGAQASDDSLQMVVQNQIPFLVPLQYEEIDSCIRLVYDISSLLPFTEYLEGRRLARGILISLVRGIGACSQKLQEYLLDPKLLMLRPDCIFMDAQAGEEKKRFFFCYNPFYQGQQQQDLQGVFERIIACIDYEDQELVRMTYEMFMLVQGENVQWKDVEAVIRKPSSGAGSFRIDPEPFIQVQKEEQKIASIHKSEKDETDEAGYAHFAGDEGYEEYSRACRNLAERDHKAEGQNFFSNFRRYLKKHSFREVLTDIDDGIILQKIHDEAAPLPRHALEGVGEQTKEYIELVKFPFYIGKLQGKSDYILDRDTISRNHLCICRDSREEDCCLIIDQKSRNGTYLNGKRIRPLVKERVREGDHIRLADVEFIFH